MSDLWFEAALLPDGWANRVTVGIRGGRIAHIAADTPPPPGAERHAVALPGLANLHSHAFQRAMAGLTERRGAQADSFWTWRELMYRFAQALDPDLMAAVAAQAFVEMLESGFTRVGEFHYIHHAPDGGGYAEPAAMAGAVAAAAGETGIGLTLLPVFYAASGFGGAAPSALQRRFVTDPAGFARLVEASATALAGLPDAVVGVAPHSLRAVPPDMLRDVAALRPDAPVHIHVAEQLREVEDCLDWSGKRPVEWLMASAEVDARWCLIHATHVTPAEVAAIARSGAVVGLCPVTEANLGDGIFPAAEFVSAGGRFGVGSDSNVGIDAAGELRLLEYGQRLVRRERNVLAGAANRATGRALFDAAVAGGGQALGVRAGLIEGASADIVTLKTDHPALACRSGDAWLDGWIFAAGSGAIDRVWRHGTLVVTNGVHVAREPVAARYRQALRRLVDGD